MATWRRFLRHDDEKGDELVEIAAIGLAIWERRGRVRAEPRVTRTEVKVKGGGWDHYGVEDEIRARVAELAARTSTTPAPDLS